LVSLPRPQVEAYVAARRDDFATLERKIAASVARAAAAGGPPGVRGSASATAMDEGAYVVMVHVIQVI